MSEEKPVVQQVLDQPLPHIEMGTSDRLYTGRVLDREPGSPVWLQGNVYRHSHGGEDSLLGPLPHLSPFTLQPVTRREANQKKISKRSKKKKKKALETRGMYFLPAHALFPPLQDRCTTLGYGFTFTVFLYQLLHILSSHEDNVNIDKQYSNKLNRTLMHHVLSGPVIC